MTPIHLETKQQTDTTPTQMTSHSSMKSSSRRGETTRHCWSHLWRILPSQPTSSTGCAPPCHKDTAAHQVPDIRKTPMAATEQHRDQAATLSKHHLKTLRGSIPRRLLKVRDILARFTTTAPCHILYIPHTSKTNKKRDRKNHKNIA